MGELYLQLNYLPKTAVPDEVPFFFSLNKWDSVPPDGRRVYAEAPICLLEWVVPGGKDDEALGKLSRESGPVVYHGLDVLGAVALKGG